MSHYFEKSRASPLSLDPRSQAPFEQIYRCLKKQTLEVLGKNRTVASDERVYLSRSDIELIGSHLETAISEQVKVQEKHLHILSTIVSLAPFLGLLGTVWGILLTFSQLQQGGGAASATVMGGLAMALGTTVLGLLVAIPALVFYNLLKAQSTHFASDMEDFSHRLLAAVELNFRKVDVQ